MPHALWIILNFRGCWLAFSILDFLPSVDFLLSRAVLMFLSASTRLVLAQTVVLRGLVLSGSFLMWGWTPPPKRRAYLCLVGPILALVLWFAGTAGIGDKEHFVGNLNFIWLWTIVVRCSVRIELNFARSWQRP